MGLAASQARLLSLTSRIHDVEFEAQQVQYAKMRLALRESDVEQKYIDALDQETLTISGPDNTRIKATFDNLCGLGSINNNFGRSHYVFRDKSDRLIVPNDVYNGYLSYGGNDPYEFAMYMMTGVKSDNSDYEKTVNDLMLNEKNKDLQDLKNDIYDQIELLFSSTASYKETYKTSEPDKTSDNYKEFLSKFQDEIFKHLLNDSDVSINANFENLDQTVNGKSIKDIIANLKESAQEYEFKLYKKHGGAEAIYKAVRNEDFDQKTYDYYVRWGQLIQKEGGIVGEGDNRYLDGCTNASDYNNEIETDPELLNQNIMSGYIRIDVVYDDYKGGISETMTSTAIDTNVHMDKVDKVDPTILKKAEAERDAELRKISRIDKNYDLNLNRLETERTALTTEYDSVKKVIQDNIDRTFKIFS